MPIVLKNVADLQEYVSRYALCPILYKRDGLNFIIAAGKIAWKGSVKTEQEADKLEAFLIERGAFNVEGYENNEVLFG